MPRPKGWLVRSMLYHAGCGMCEATDSDDSSSSWKESAGKFRAAGWRYRKDVGWICPECAGKKEKE